MHGFTLSTVALCLLVSASGQLQQQAESLSIFPPRVCAPSCSTARVARATTDDVDAALKLRPDIQAKIAELDAEQGTQEKSIIQPVSYRCPCASKCEAVREQLYSCNNCRIIWPRFGVTNVRCKSPGSYCPLGSNQCGCPGRCNAYGRRSQPVLLYCPHSKEVFDFRYINLCTNCCCQYNYWWKG